MIGARYGYLANRALIDQNALYTGLALSTQAIQTQILSNHTYSINNAFGSAAPILFNGNPITTRTGKVRVIAGMQVQGTSGDTVQFNLTSGGSVIVLSAQATAQLSPDEPGFANATLVQEFTITPGATITYGIRCIDVTTPSSPLTIQVFSAFVDVSELF